MHYTVNHFPQGTRTKSISIYFGEYADRTNIARS